MFLGALARKNSFGGKCPGGCLWQKMLVFLFFFFFVGDDAQVIVAAISLKDRSSNRYRSYHSSHFPLQESSPPS